MTGRSAYGNGHVHLGGGLQTAGLVEDALGWAGPQDVGGGLDTHHGRGHGESTRGQHPVVLELSDLWWWLIEQGNAQLKGSGQVVAAFHPEP